MALWAQIANYGSHFIWDIEIKTFYNPSNNLITKQSFANLCLFLSDCYWYGSKQRLLTLFLIFDKIEQNVNNNKSLHYHGVTVIL